MDPLDPWQRVIEARVADLEESHAELRKIQHEMKVSMQENTRLTKETNDGLEMVKTGLNAVRTNTEDIVTFLQGSRMAGKVIAFFGGIAAAFTAMGALVYGIYYLVKHGAPPPS